VTLCKELYYDVKSEPPCSMIGFIQYILSTNVAATPQNIIFKDIKVLENVQRNKKKGEFTRHQVSSN